MAADADARSLAPEGDSAEGPGPASTAEGASVLVAADGELLVRIDCDADALAHLDGDGALDADAARELAALLDGYAAERDGR